MKTVNVTFPDGSIREWPAKERLQQSREIPPGPPNVVLEPKSNPEWRFQAVVGGWRARPR